MKRFLYTAGGKTTLFLITVFSVILTAVFSIAAGAMIGQGFYTQSKAQMTNRVRTELLEEYGREIIYHKLGFHIDREIPGFDWLLWGEDGKLIAWMGDSALSEDTGSDKSIAENWELHYNVARDADDRGSIRSVIVYDPDDPPVFEDGSKNYSVTLFLRDDAETFLPFRLFPKLIAAGYRLRYIVYLLILLFLLTGIFSFVGLMCVSGRRNGQEELFPGPLHKVPTDLLLLLTLLPATLLYISLLEEFSGSGAAFIIPACLGAVPLFLLLLSLSMSIAVRIKTRTTMKNTLIYRILRVLIRGLRALFTGISYVVRNTPLIWRTALSIVLFSALELFMIVNFGGSRTDVLFSFWLFEKILLVPPVILAAIALRRLERAGQALASGNLTGKVDTRGLFLNFRAHAENLNRLSGTISEQVEERIRSERMKTELITNVSHDLKTPLTSIINYSDLIAREPCDNPKITEYAEVLTRHSDKLRRLIEDLVEVSKASSGNLEVSPEPCDANVFLSQSAGEYAERLKNAGLTAVVETQPAPVMILADPRRMWRVFDNLMSNVCKYAQSGTRVYMDLALTDTGVCMMIKNISREPLNLSPEELTERFVRGDVSRSTDGNGLGLSIAASLVELQGGTFQISVDGDLFKASLCFPLLLPGDSR